MYVNPHMHLYIDKCANLKYDIFLQLEEGQEKSASDDLGAWKKIWQCPVQDVVARIVETLADDEGKKVENGFHLVVMPAENEMLFQSPPAGTRLKIILTDSPFEALVEVKIRTNVTQCMSCCWSQLAFFPSIAMPTRVNFG
jgi:hypothetical protein